jgi:D-amino peptidase
MKAYIFSDMEGVAGIEEFDDRKDTSHANVTLRRRNQHLLTQELNAAAAGAFDGGADDVVIKMGHADSILFEELDERVTFIRKGVTWLQGIDENVDACFFVGSHSRAGTADGVLEHTWSRSVKGWFVNDLELGELGICALIAGCYGIPYVFHSGDTASCREAQALIPGVVTAAVKKGYGIHSAAHLSKERARALIREKAREAMSRVGHVAPFKVDPNPESPLYVFRQVAHTGERTVSDDGKGTRVITPDTVEYYGDDLLTVLRRGTY